jgi:hypothetical protein
MKPQAKEELFFKPTAAFALFYQAANLKTEQQKKHYQREAH